MYVYGYVFVLTFPLLAYFALDDMQFLRETCVAYTLNYAIGLLWYVAFIAYGPRNLMPDIVEPLLYTSWPEAKMLTTRVNTNTNVFPSLHSSLAATVLLLAYRSREHYPAWLLLAAVFSGSIVVSTMYLGIHWGIDVVAGAVLAVISVRVATNVDEVPHEKNCPQRWVRSEWWVERLESE
jgi:membrane-associated phospholipid phosphatase